MFYNVRQDSWKCIYVHDSHKWCISRISCPRYVQSQCVPLCMSSPMVSCWSNESDNSWGDRLIHQAQRKHNWIDYQLVNVSDLYGMSFLPIWLQNCIYIDNVFVQQEWLTVGCVWFISQGVPVVMEAGGCDHLLLVFLYSV